MIIGIHALAAFKRPRTGVEEYTYQLIKHLTMLEGAKRHRFVLYTNQTDQSFNQDQIRHLKWPFPMWTQIRLGLEMILKKPDLLFIPAHVLPLIHPKKSVVVIHGLEYEYCPEMYPKKHLKYLRWSTKYAVEHAQKIIAVSQNTRDDLISLYRADPDKIAMIHHGFSINRKAKKKKFDWPYILFLSRLETKKNVHGLIKTFNFLKERYQIPHKLVLAGPFGFGFEGNKSDQIVTTGYISRDQKWSLLKGADMFILPSFYEGFGLPILEAQAAGVPVITSNLSSMPEVAGSGALLINPRDTSQISEAIYKLIKSDKIKRDLIEKGYQNIKRFSWQKCARETLNLLNDL